MSSNGKSLQALAAAALRVLKLNAEKEAAVARLETSTMYYQDQAALEMLADELTPANRRLVERALRCSFYHPARDRRPATDPAHDRAVVEAAAAEATALLADRQALDVVLIARASLEAAKNPGQVEARLARLREAEESHRLARQALEGARARVVNLQQQRANRERAILLEQSTSSSVSRGSESTASGKWLT